MFAVTFYILSAVLIASASFVVAAKNPVHSVLWLIMAFLTAAALFLTLDAEFLAMLLMIVYVGAVAVLFLFVVMMLDIDFVELKKITMANLGMGLLVSLVLVSEFILVAKSAQTPISSTPLSPIAADIPNTRALGLLIYEQYTIVFLTAGMVLLVAMIGAIILTMQHRTDVKRQNILTQMYRDPKKTMELVDVKPGQGIK